MRFVDSIVCQLPWRVMKRPRVCSLKRLVIVYCKNRVIVFVSYRMTILLMAELLICFVCLMPAQGAWRLDLCTTLRSARATNKINYNGVNGSSNLVTTSPQ